MLNNSTLIILAGGKSTRMGTDKALLKYKGKTFVQFLYDKFKNICSEVLISSNNPEVVIPEIKTVTDEIKNIGPMGGIYSCLKESNSKKNIVISVDSPFISKEIIKMLVKKSENYEICIAKHEEKLHPLIGVYDKNSINIFKSEINLKKYKMLMLIEKTNHNIVSFGNSFNKNFKNINKPEEYKHLR